MSATLKPPAYKGLSIVLGGEALVLSAFAPPK